MGAPPPVETTLTDALGNVSVHTFKMVFGLPRSKSVSAPCGGCNAAASATTYDANGFLKSETDFKGTKTDYLFNARGLEESRTEGVGTTEVRTVTTVWEPNYRVPTKITETKPNDTSPDKETSFVYSSGRLMSRTETDLTTPTNTRTTTFTYYPSGIKTGLLHTIDGPLLDDDPNPPDDITEFFYDDEEGGETGNLTKVLNAEGHVTEFLEYDAHGRPEKIT